MNMEDTLFNNLYKQYRNPELPKDVFDLPAFRKANEAFTEILGDEDYLDGKNVNLSKIEEMIDE